MISDRIEALIAHFCNGNKSLFAQKIGVTPSVIGNLTGERKGNPSFEVIQKVLDAFASVNPDWFILDRGFMLRNSKNSEEPTIGDVPNVVPISSAEESIIYKMYKDEKEEKERMLKEKDAENKHLQSELRAKSEELAVLKALHSQSQDKEPEHHSSMDKALELFSLEPSEASIKGYSPTSPPAKSSTKLSAGKIY